MKHVFVFALCAILLAGCSAQVDADAVATIVAATLQANAQLPTPQTGGGLQGLTGTVEGSLCFPSSGIPPMNLYLQPSDASEPVVIPIAQDQGTFNAELIAGTYTAYAWLPDFSFGGSYSQMVACGLTVDCTDHSLLAFDVTAGATTSGIDVCDWYGAPGDVPLPPGAQTPTGSIAGTLIFPSESVPAMQVVAFSLNGSDWYVTSTVQGQSTFQIDNLPLGDYYIVAYLAGDDYGGGYTPAVVCGLSVDCTDHSLIAVNIQGGQVTTDVMPHDWYAPAGSFPPNPNP